MNLDKADGDTLFYVAELQNIWTEEEYCFADNSNGYRFILPLEWVKPEESEEPEKKYRPFSLEEFLKIFDVADQIEFRNKDNGEVKHTMFIGYAKDDVMIGIYRFSLSYLFENYELFFEDKWQPFGVIDE